MSKVENSMLRDAAIELMRQNGKPLTRIPNKTKSMLYRMDTGETVRIRTCNKHVMIAVGRTPDVDADLNIEGTDYLLIAMPEVENQHGRVLAYLIPTEIVANEAREKHREWLADEKTEASGFGRTKNLWFREHYKSGGYHRHWKQYLLPGEVKTTEPTEINANSGNGDLRSIIQDSQRRIALAAGVEPAAVKISVDFAA